MFYLSTPIPQTESLFHVIFPAGILFLNQCPKTTKVQLILSYFIMILFVFPFI